MTIPNPFQQTLARKVVGLAVLNVVLLAAAAFAFGAFEYRLGPESLLLAPARDRVEGVGFQFADQMNAQGADPQVLLTRYGARYGAEFLLIDPDGAPLVGLARQIPKALIERMRGHGRRPPGEPKEGRPKEGKKEDRKGDIAQRKGDDTGGPHPPPPNEPSFFFITANPLTYWAGVRMPYQPGGVGPNLPAVLLIRSESIFNNSLFFDIWLWAGGCAAVLSISALCWLPFLRSLAKSIAVMDKATGQIADGRFDVHIPQNRNDELGHLGKQISRMSGRLDHFVRNQKRFLGDIAHELCAPIARIQFALGILEQRAGEEGERDIARLRLEIQEMSDLVNELLQFSKADVESGVILRQPVEVAAIVGRAIARESVPSSGVDIQVEPGLSVMANEVYLGRALANVIRNARRYASDTGPIEIRAQDQGGKVSIEIADFGPGLAPGTLDQVFEPFYRPESDRSRSSGGAGLGLAIVKTCLEACGGTASCVNREPHGLVVRFVLQRA